MEKKINQEDILLGEFISRLGEFCNREIPDPLQWRYEAGWLETQDISEKEQSLKRKTAARILHQFLRLERKEADVDASAVAGKLQDLYDCRVCAGHVMQIYAKGIMDGYRTPDGGYVFGMNDPVTEEECGQILERLMHPERRVVPDSKSDKESDKEESKKLSEEDAFRILQTERKVLLLDVRSEAEFESSHIKGAVSMPLIRILKNPYGVSERRDKKILLYCEMGIQSGMAAECLMEAGFEQVYSFAWDANASEILEYLNL